MMSKIELNTPTLILLYGYPGAGKTYFARQIADELHAAHVQADRFRFELFEEPRFDKNENRIVDHLAQYMAQEFLSAGVSVIYDLSSSRAGQRRMLRYLARKLKSQCMMVWVQIDTESAFERVAKRDRRKTDDKYAVTMDRTTFDEVTGKMQNPQTNEDYVVVSGKHHFQTQRTAFLKKLHSLGLISSSTATDGVPKPGLVNLVPAALAGRVDQSRRNISIR
jgi:predicted kinase